MNNDFAKRYQKDVHDFYEKHGKAFAVTRQTLWPEQILTAKHIRPNMTVLDIGAGNGRFHSTLPKEVKYLGIEPSKSLRESAQKNCQLLPGALPDINLQNQSADITTCFAVLHHIPGKDKRRACVEELIRLTKLQGKIFASAWYIPEGKYQAVKDSREQDVYVPWRAEGAKAERFVHRFTLDEWKELWTHPELEIKHIGYFGKEDWTKNPKKARNLFVIAKRKSA